MAASMVHLATQIVLDAPVERLWPLLSDTDRVNRMVGLPAFERTEPGPDLAQVISGHYLGVPVRWREYPFEWVYEQQFSVERAFEPPLPIESLVTHTRLVPLAGAKTRVEVTVDLVPRNLVGALGGRLIVAQQMLRDLRAAYRTLGVLANSAADTPRPSRRRIEVNTARLDQALARLKQAPVPARLVERLRNHLQQGDDPAVLKMRPFALADVWGEPRLEVLRTFLYATRAGLLDLEWDVLCPSCRGPSLRSRTLAELGTEAHCNSCNIRYDLNFDESVELRFSVSPMVRDAVDLSYCIGGPANTPHILAQLWVPAGGSKRLQVRMPTGSYRVRSRQLKGFALLEVDERHTNAAATLTFGGDAIDAATGELAPGPAELTLVNRSSANLLVVIEQTAWSAQAASAALVTALAEFRQLFSAEVLAPGLGLSIRTLTFMFSDLKDSTRIYDQIGDSPAYARVRDHFDVLRATLAANNGALVKTIGDAVMAVFSTADDAVRAALEIQRAFTAGEIARGNPALRIKLGLHRGPCIAVNANELLDYFGSTVNIAARVQGESAGGDIVLTDAVLDDPEVQRILADAPPPERFERELRGIAHAVTLYRIPMLDVHAAVPHTGQGEVLGRAKPSQTHPLS